MSLGVCRGGGASAVFRCECVGRDIKGVRRGGMELLHTCVCHVRGRIRGCAEVGCAAHVSYREEEVAAH